MGMIIKFKKLSKKQINTKKIKKFIIKKLNLS